jgi:hypothetical protein
LKAIHNPFSINKSAIEVGNYKLKYNFESNSQPMDYELFCRIVGNYKLKYNFESNSQLKVPASLLGGCYNFQL